MFTKGMNAMEFNENEQKMIKDARKAIKSFRKLAYIIFAVWLFLLVASIAGYLEIKSFLYPSIVFIFVLFIFPGFGRGPKYVDLVKLLESKNPKKDEVEIVAEYLNEVKKT